MADGNSIDSRLAAKKKFEDFLNLLSKPDQEKAIRSQNIEEFAKIAGTSPEEAAELFDAKIEYLRPGGPTESITKDDKTKEHKETSHDQHLGYLPEEELEKTQNEPKLDDSLNRAPTSRDSSANTDKPIFPSEANEKPQPAHSPSKPPALPISPNALRSRNMSSSLRRFSKPSLGSPKRGIKRIFDAADYINSIVGLASKLSAAISTIFSGIATVASAAFAALASFISGVVAGVATAASFIGISLSTFGIVLIVALIVAVFSVALFSSPADGGAPPQDSPYPGITYSINCPTDPIAIGGTASCTIFLVYDSAHTNQATCSLGGLSLVDNLPSGTTLVQGSNLTTGTYSFDPVDNAVVWKLTDNLTQPISDQTQGFNFKVSLTSDQDVTVENQIAISGCE